jgi:hypothetical protein
MAIPLGNDPEEIVVLLTRNADFNCVLESYDTNDAPLSYPVGTTITLVFAGTVTWTANITTYQAKFSVDKNAVNSLIDTLGKNVQAIVFYTNGTDDIAWYVGRTQVRE